MRYDAHGSGRGEKHMVTRRNITTLKSGIRLEVGKGRIDDWCIYVIFPNGKIWFPKDEEYLEMMQQLTKEYGDVIYNEFVNMYRATDKYIDEKILSDIENFAAKYPDENAIALMLTILYAGMIAEENKENSILGKRIKKLAVRQVAIENISPKYAANCTKGVSWRIIDEMCKERGF